MASMDTTYTILHSNHIPLGCTALRNNRLSFRPSIKHLKCHILVNNCLRREGVESIKASKGLFSQCPLKLSPQRSRRNLLAPLRCSFSDADTLKYKNYWLKPFMNLSFDSVKASFSQLTPIRVVKWSAILSIAIAAIKWSLNLITNPFFWMYFSWTWLFWPWFVATVIGVYGLYCFRRHSLGEANVFEQLSIVTSVFTWLTLVPPAHFNGYLEGWPFVFFFVYHYFFFFSVSVRRRLYGDYFARNHDSKWDVGLPKLYSLLFSVGIMVGHWLAAFEGPELHRIPGGWSNVGVWIMILVTLFMQYNSTLYLAKYSEKVVVPTAVVQFGPFRLVRHPIYASTMLLFVTYCIALRAPLSSLFVVAVCLLYYGQKAKLEEALMVDTFGENYTDYANKVPYKFIPFVH